jgi:tetratricopeptide (TPR) repeat protein
MMAVVERADGRVLHGFQLAQRGALYSARAEFVAALQLIADANDAEQNTRMYSKALTAGLAALKEAGDFVRPNSTAAPIDVAHVSAGHKTPILKGAATGDITPLQAARRYYNYAQEQLAAAGAQETTSSMALFGVAKVAIGSAGNNKALQLERSAQAVALYQAALMTAPKNFLAANELGVLMAENGSLERAREMLMHSIALSPRAATWKNLAIVHGRLGETQLADRAKTEAAALERAGLGGSAPAVRWVDPDQFASIIPASDNVLPAVAPLKSPPSAVQPATEAPKPPGQTAKRSSDWLPWNSRR